MSEPPTPEPRAPLVQLDDLQVHFPLRRGVLFERTVGHIKAVDGVSFDIRRGETFGLVGESGCGKTTVARTLLRLVKPTGGQVRFDGKDITGLDAQGARLFTRRVQSVFQDPFSSLNPRMRVLDIVAEPLVVHLAARGEKLRARVFELLDICGLPTSFAERYPHEMSGGQRQRVGIARALALEPELVVCDEAVSALDVSIQAQIINLLARLQAEFGLTYLFIGHDLSVVRHLCDRVGVMYLGRLVEVATSDQLFAEPRHPYTQALIRAVPVPDPAIEKDRAHNALTGEVPSPISPPTGCVFHPRCPIAVPSCAQVVPALVDSPDGRSLACPVADDVSTTGSRPGSERKTA